MQTQELLTGAEYQFWPDIMNDLKQLLETKEGCDVIIYVGEEPNIGEFYAHSLILGCRSQYFLMLFSKSMIEKKNEWFIFKKPNISSDIFHHILNYIYCGEIDLKKCTSEEILSIIIAASEFCLDKLVQHSKEFLHANRKDIIRNGNPFECLTLSFSHESLSSLQETVVQLISQEPKMIFDTQYFYSLPSDILEMLIKRGDLILDEITIWENLVKWCIYQHKHFEEDEEDIVKNLSGQEINDIKSFLEKYLYLINFKEITAQEFLNKVMPYEELLSKEFKISILRTYMFVGSPDKIEVFPQSPITSSPITSPITSLATVPQRKICVQIDSNLINHLHVALFAAWIDKQPEMYHSSKYIIYDFNLLFRSTRDGTSGNSFHQKCDNKGPTIVIAKIKGSKRLIGGYNPLGWEGNCIKSTMDSFLFSFGDLNDIDTRRIGRVIKPKEAVRCFKSWGPIFGDLNGDSNDLVMTGLGYWSSSSGSYQNVGIPNHFKVEEWEVFQIKKKKEYEVLGI